MKHIHCIFIIGYFLFGGYCAHAQPLPEKRDVTAHLTLDGKPAAGYAVDIMRIDRDAVAAVWGGVVTTDDGGSFHLPNMEDGIYRLKVHNVASGAPLFVMPECTVSDGHTRWDVALQRFPMLKLKLVAPNGKPVQGGKCALEYNITTDRLSQPSVIMESIDPNTSICSHQLYSLGTIKGLKIVTPGTGVAVYGKPIELEPDKDIDLTMPLVRGSTLQVCVFETGQAQSGKSTAMPADAVPVGDISIAMRPFDSDPSTPLGPQDTPLRFVPKTHDGDGAVTLEYLFPGAYRVHPLMEESELYAPVEQTVLLKDGGSAIVTFYAKARHLPSLHLQLTTAAGKPIAKQEVEVQLYNTGNTHRRKSWRQPIIRYNTTDAAGALTLYPVPKGTYRINVLRDGSDAEQSLIGTLNDVVINDQGGTAKLAGKE